MLENIQSREDCGSLARVKARNYETKTVSLSKVDSFLSKGWQVDKKNESSIRIRKDKSHDKLLEDRVWTLLYKMGFEYLSGEGGGILKLKPKDINSPKNQIDAVGIDNEVALAIECKSSEKRTSRPQFQDELGKFSLIRERFAAEINGRFATTHKRQIVLVMCYSNIFLSENDKRRAAEANVIVFDELDLEYYENLVLHIGPAAKYQLFSDMLPGKRIPGLEIKVPAIKSRMGGKNCYTFSISPEYLLKISYISHRARGNQSDITTYQRMISKSRLNKIKKYIDDNGIFPTNIVLNLEQKAVQFDKIGHEFNGKHDIEHGILGWLTIRPAYKSAWIIDGQHRLYSYSGHEKSNKSRLSILAFEGLPSSKQAQLFIDINAKQKSVKQSLLQELYADLHKDSSDVNVRKGAIVSKSIQILGNDPDSPLFGRIQSADVSKDNIRCISLASVFGALEKSYFHISKVKNGVAIEYGPLWAGTNEDTIDRTVFILKEWLNSVRSGAPDWWDKGSADGGGLAMNDGIITCLNILRSVFQHLEGSGAKLLHLDNKELAEMIAPYSLALGEYFGALTEEERKGFRNLRGIQGQTTRTKRCQIAIRSKLPHFNPPGLDEFLEQEKAQNHIKAKEVVNWIETTMQKVVIEELKREHGVVAQEWWFIGVPKQVRLKVTERLEQNDNQRGGREYYFDLMDYRKIILDNWGLFEPLFAYQKSGNKETRTSWLVEVNNLNNIISHPSSAITVTSEQVAELNEYKSWLYMKLQGKDHEISPDDDLG